MRAKPHPFARLSARPAAGLAAKPGTSLQSKPGTSLPSKPVAAVAALACLLAVGTMLSCNRKEKGVVPEGKLVELLADLETGEAYARRPEAGLPQDRDSIGLGILAAHGVSPEQLDSTLGWYGRNLDDYAELYDKVDRELSRRLAKASARQEGEEQGATDLWNGSRFFRVTPADLSETALLDLREPGLERGQVVEWKMRLTGQSQAVMTLGVEYSDGESRYQVQNLYAERRSGVTLPTDTARDVVRLFGTLSIPLTPSSEPLLIDSITLRALPMDSTQLFRVRHQQKFTDK